MIKFFKYILACFRADNTSISNNIKDNFPYYYVVNIHKLDKKDDNKS